MAVKFAIFAGILIRDEIVAQIDLDGDGQMSDPELNVWIENTWAPEISLSLDALTTIPVNGETAHASWVGQPDLVLLSQPLMVEVDVAIPDDGLPHQLLIRNDYESHRSDYDLQILTMESTSGEQLSNNGRAMVVEFETDPDAADGELSQASFTSVLYSADKSFMDKVMDQILWIGIGIIVIAAGAWLGYLRYKEKKAVKAAAAKKSAPKPIKATGSAQTAIDPDGPPEPGQQEEAGRGQDDRCA